MSDKEEVSLHDEIRAAFASNNAKTEDDKVDNAGIIDALEARDEDQDQAADKEDDQKPTVESVKGDEASAATADEGAAEEAGGAEVKLSDGKAPSSWSPKVREKWAELPEEVRAEIIRREEASVNGVRKLQEEYAPVKQLAQNLDPFIQEARKSGMDAGQYISNVMQAERNLRAPDVESRFQALLNIADQYGIPLRQAINQSAGRELVPAQQQPQLPPEVMQELQEARKWREQSQAQSIEQQINMFKSSAEHEFYEDVRDIMADLIEAGRAKDLKDAYDQAVWLNPEVRSVLIDREKGGRQQQQIQQRQAAAAGASVQASGAADVQVDDDDDDSTEAIVRRAMRGSAGRV